MLVTTFPQGIDEAFDSLIRKTGDCAGNRDYYGIAKQDSNGQMTYYATAVEKLPGEAEEFGYDTFTVEKGEYLAETVKDWKNKTGDIKKIFDK